MQWIQDFSRELSISFNSLKLLESNKSNYYNRLKSIRGEKSLPAFVYPFIIKGYKFFKSDSNELDILFHLMEILTFRYYLIGSRAELNSRLSDILRDFNGNVILLRDSLKKKLNDSWYWSDTRIKDFLNGWMYENPVLHYLLWQYEDSLQNKGYQIGNCIMKMNRLNISLPKIHQKGDTSFWI